MTRTLPELPAQVDLIDGRRQVPTGVLDGTIDDPNTGTVLQERRCSSPGAVDDAVAAAARVHAQGTWRKLGEKRVAMLDALATELDLRADELTSVESLDTGVPVSVTSQIAAALGDIVRSAADQLSRRGSCRRLDRGGRRVELLDVPWGVAALILPWNAPAPTLATKAANALAMGCPIVIKPSEWAPHAAAFFADAVEAAGLPTGVVNVVHGDARVGKRLVSNPHVAVVSVTGGTSAGRSIAAATAERFASVQLELGGANAAVVLDDADIALASRALARGMTKLNGQWCEAPRRIIASQRLLEPLVDALVHELRSIQLGHSLEPETEVGPLGHRTHLEHVASQIEALVGAGGALVEVGDVPALGGWFLAPTLVVAPDPRAALDEVFAPVAVVHGFERDSDALELARLPGDGLASYVFSTDVERGLAFGTELPGGEVKINGTSLLDLSPESEQSFFGSSGVGGHGAELAREVYVGSRIVGVDHLYAPI